MNDLSFLFITGQEPVTRDLSQTIELGLNTTGVGMLAVFLGLILLVLFLNVFQWIMRAYTKLMFKSLIKVPGSTAFKSTKPIEQISPAFKIDIGRQPSTEEVAAIAATLYIQRIEIEAEHRYIRSFKRNKQGLHAWKESSKFQLFNRTRR